MNTTKRMAHDDVWLHRLVAAAPKMARLLLLLEAESYADARPCPFCDASEEGDGSSLPHAANCELDRTMSEAGLRSVPPLAIEDVPSRFRRRS